MALDHAERAGDERVRDFYPSLYLNLAHAHELGGALDEAKRYHTLAAEAAIDTVVWCMARSR